MCVSAAGHQTLEKRARAVPDCIPLCTVLLATSHMPVFMGKARGLSTRTALSHLEGKIHEELPPQQQQRALQLLTHTEVAGHQGAHTMPPRNLQVRFRD